MFYKSYFEDYGAYNPIVEGSQFDKNRFILSGVSYSGSRETKIGTNLNIFEDYCLLIYFKAVVNLNR